MGELTECDDIAELLAEVATGAASGPDRARVLRHLNRCAQCRADLEELTKVADDVLLIAPEHEPPARFESAVLDRLRVEGVRRSRRWVRPVAYAAAAVLLAVGGAGVVWQATSDDRELASSYRDTLDVADGWYFSAAALERADGESIGTVFFYDGSPSWVFVVVKDAPPAGYDVIVTTGQRRISVAECVVEQRSCSAGTSIDFSVAEIDSVSLVSPEGVEVAVAVK